MNLGNKKFVVDGKIYNSFEEMPPESRKKVEEMLGNYTNFFNLPFSGKNQNSTLGKLPEDNFKKILFYILLILPFILLLFPAIIPFLPKSWLTFSNIKIFTFLFWAIIGGVFFFYAIFRFISLMLFRQKAQ